jgi:RNA polymerase sigma factor (sigma-70 family)
MNAITHEDLVHEALTVIHNKYKEMEFEKGILPWAYGVLDTVLISHWSRKKLHEDLINENINRVQNIQIDEEPADMLYEKKETIDIIKNALEHSNNGEKEIFELKLQGYSGEEIQNKLGLKRSAMDVRIHRAVQKMKKILCNQGITYDEM